MRPLTSAGSRVRMSPVSGTCPSYSSPCTPDVSSTVGPSPFLMQTSGTGSQP